MWHFSTSPWLWAWQGISSSSSPFLRYSWQYCPPQAREDAIVTVAAAYLENLQDAEGNSQERVLVLVHSEILPEKRECWLTSFRRPCCPADTRTSRRSQESHQARISRRASS